MGRRVEVFLKAGETFGYLEVLDPEAGRVSRNRHRPKGRRAARVKCLLCGTVKLVAIDNLRCKHGTVSCGCFRWAVRTKE